MHPLSLFYFIFIDGLHHPIPVACYFIAALHGIPPTQAVAKPAVAAVAQVKRLSTTILMGKTVGSIIVPVQHKRFTVLLAANDNLCCCVSKLLNVDYCRVFFSMWI